MPGPEAPGKEEADNAGPGVRNTEANVSDYINWEGAKEHSCS